MKAAGYLYLGTLVSIILGRRMGKFENTFAGNFMKYMDAIRHGMSRLPREYSFYDTYGFFSEAWCNS